MHTCAIPDIGSLFDLTQTRWQDHAAGAQFDPIRPLHKLALATGQKNAPESVEGKNSRQGADEKYEYGQYERGIHSQSRLIQ
jgi:hypothetical protein